MEERILIRLVRQRRELFDKDDENYLNVEVKNRAWKEISNILKISEVICKAKWRNLRDVYRKSKRKVIDPDPKAQLKKTKWKYNKQMAFLKPYLRASENPDTYDFSDDEIQQKEFEPKLDPLDPHPLEYYFPDVRNPTDPMTQFFIAMGAAAKRLPFHLLVEAKTKVFEAIRDLETESLHSTSRGDHSYA